MGLLRSKKPKTNHWHIHSLSNLNTPRAITQFGSQDFIFRLLDHKLIYSHSYLHEFAQTIILYWRNIWILTRQTSAFFLFIGCSFGQNKYFWITSAVSKVASQKNSWLFLNLLKYFQITSAVLKLAGQNKSCLFLNFFEGTWDARTVETIKTTNSCPFGLKPGKNNSLSYLIRDSDPVLQIEAG